MGVPGKTKTEATNFDSWTVEVGFLVHNYLNPITVFEGRNTTEQALAKFNMIM